MLRALPQMTRLVKLELCGGLISDKGVSSLAGLVALEALNLRENINITSRGIAYLCQLSHLCHLNLSHTGVTGSAAVHMSRLFRLRILCLFGCKFGEGAVAWLMEALPCIRLAKLILVFLLRILQPPFLLIVYPLLCLQSLDLRAIKRDRPVSSVESRGFFQFMN